MTEQKIVSEEALTAIASDIKTAIGTKANTAGEYDYLTVGLAKQLKTSVGENDKEPYNFRTSGGSIEIGDREEDKIIGGTVAWNQLINPRTTPTTSYQVTFTFTSDGKCSMSGTASGGTAVATIFNAFSALQGHKYLILGGLNENIYLVVTNVTVWGSSNRFDTGNGTIISANASGQVALNAQVSDGTNASGKVMSPMFIDLTAMFGSTIADYIYSLEQATAGAGVAWFRKLFPNSYYPYDAGSLKSVKTTAHKMVGKNLWESTDNNVLGFVGDDIAYLSGTGTIIIAHLISGVTYTISGVTGKNRGIIGYFTSTPSFNDTAFAYQSFGNPDLTFTANNSGLAYIYIANSVIDTTNGQLEIGSQATAYEPYTEHNYPLDSDLELRGIPKLDNNNKLYYDGDVYEHTGDVTRKYIIVDLSTITDWTQSSSTTADGSTCFYSNVIAGLSTETTLTNFISNRFTGAPTQYISDMLNNTAILSNGRIYIAVNNNDKSGVFLCPLATPTAETAQPFTNPQIVDNLGTEEYVDARTIPIPVGHDTMYQANLREKLEMSPNSPNGDGDYIVRQTNGYNAYVPLIKELPALPSSDGNYVLKCTVSGSTKTLTWVEDT